MLKSDSTLFERLDKVRNTNMESYYKRFPEQRHSPVSAHHHSDIIETLDMTDPTDNQSSATIIKMRLKIESLVLLLSFSLH